MLSEEPAGDVRFTMLGEFTLLADGKPVHLGPPRQRCLLALLATRAGSVVSVSEVLSCLWGDSPPRHAVATLQSYISRLRRVLRGVADGRFASISGQLHGYTLHTDPAATDVHLFETKVAQCRRFVDQGDPKAAGSAASEAFSLWKGTPLGDLTDYGFAQREVARLEGLRVLALEKWSEALLMLGSYDDVIIALTEELRRTPDKERLAQLLMQAQYHSGRPAEALVTFATIRAHLAEELGVDASMELKKLHQSVLRHDLPRLESAHGAAAFTPPGMREGVSAPHSPEYLMDMFIGRRAELRRIRASCAVALSGAGRTMLVVGEPGVGKKRLVREAMRDLGDVRVSRGHGVAGRPSPPYWVWEQLLRQLPEAAAQFEDMVRTGSPSDGSSVDEGTLCAEPFQLSDRVCRVLSTALGRRPTVLVLEDLHFADVGSLELLTQVTRAVRDVPLFLVATLRESRLRDDPMLRREAARLFQEDNADVLHLAGLSDDEVDGMLTARGKPSARQVVQALRAACDGSPYLIASLVDAAPAELDATVTTYPVPLKVTEVLHEWFTECSREERTVLAAVAVAGGQVSRQVLVDVVGAMGEHSDIVHTALRTGLLRTAAQGGLDDVTVCFTHGLLRDVVYDSLPAAVRARWHQEFGHRLSQQEAADEEATRAIREHWLRAALVLGSEQGLAPLLSLAREAYTHLLYTRASRYVCLAVDVVTALPPSMAHTKLELSLRRHQIRMVSLLEGHGSRGIGQLVGKARQLEEYLDSTRPTDLLHTQALAALTVGDLAEADRIARLVREISVAGDGLADEAAAAYVNGVVLHIRGELSLALGSLLKSVELADSLAPVTSGDEKGDWRVRDCHVDGRVYLALTHRLLGNPDESQRIRAEFLTITETSPYRRPWYRGFALYADALLAILDGDVNHAGHAASVGLDLAARCGLGFWQSMHSALLGWAEVHQGRHDQGLRRMQNAELSALRSRSYIRRSLHLGLLAEAQSYAHRPMHAQRTCAAAAQNIEAFGENVYVREQWPFATLLRDDSVAPVPAVRHPV
ncbi:AAA family ATPase [Streptomyces sp. NBC_01485]|uniref:BTAD domain-containing putative transcriptional regulator n=1 Tax=Streptomyces sp. NBC_01485 TaxID=2903884 RepID=UPI002E36E800|nr:BTAD domain-containing putative transcriptional regulator [Streptomyces sp. NBC_01485]